MEPNSQRVKREQLDREVISRYEELYKHHLEEAQKIGKILAAFGKQATNGAIQVRLKASITAPIIYDLRVFLEKRGKPTHQSDIIKAIGSARAQKYPTLLRPYADVWKSLEYQARNNLEIVPVERRGGRFVQTELKRKTRQPRVIGGTKDAPELYEKPDNLFWFKTELMAANGKK